MHTLLKKIPLLGIYTEDTIKDVHDENVCWNIFIQKRWKFKGLANKMVGHPYLLEHYAL